MNFTRNIGFLTLSIYLILVGVTGLIPAVVIPSMVFAVLALIAGIFILIQK